ncbi:MAG: hypothetical protein AABX77_00250, partial [Nanoarchaeota archaeon]
GENDEKIKEILRKEYKKEIKIEEAIKLALNIFKKVLGDKFNINRFDIAYIKKEEAKLKKLRKDEAEKYS